MSDIRDLIQICEAKITKADVKGTQKSQIKLLGTEILILAKQNNIISLSTSEGSINIPVKKITEVLDELMKFSDQNE